MALNSIEYWRDALDKATDDTSRLFAQNTLELYQRDLERFEGMRKRREQNEMLAKVKIAPPPLTFLEILVTPIYIFQLFLGYIILGGIWSILGAALLGLLIGGSFMH